MNTLAKIASVCQSGKFKRSVEGNRVEVLGLLDRALETRPDLVCLPEAFSDVAVEGAIEDLAEPLDGPTISAFAARARGAGCYVVCPIHTLEDGAVYNSAVVLDRRGKIAGVYHKLCPVTTSSDYTVFEGVARGDSIPIFELDFGRVGIQICFDINYPENWQALADQGARVVLWPSAYDGGFPLRAYAYLHHFYVLTSTRTGQSRLVDPCGEILEETTEDCPVIARTVNLDYIVSHWDWNMGIPKQIRARYGDRVAVRQWDTGSAHFIVEPLDPALSAADIQREFGFESSAQYYERHRRAYSCMASGQSPEPQQALHGDRPEWGE